MWKFLKRLVDRVMEEIWESFKVLIVATGGFAVITMVGLMLVGEINIFLGIPVLVVFLLVGNVLMGGEESGECLAVLAIITGVVIVVVALAIPIVVALAISRAVGII